MRPVDPGERTGERLLQFAEEAHEWWERYADVLDYQLWDEHPNRDQIIWHKEVAKAWEDMNILIKETKEGG